MDWSFCCGAGQCTIADLARNKKKTVSVNFLKHYEGTWEWFVEGPALPGGTAIGQAPDPSLPEDLDGATDHGEVVGLEPTTPDQQTIPDKGSQAGVSFESPISPVNRQRVMPPGVSPRQMLPGRRPLRSRTQVPRIRSGDGGSDPESTQSENHSQNETTPIVTRTNDNVCPSNEGNNDKIVENNICSKSRQLERQHQPVDPPAPSAAAPAQRVSSRCTKGTKPPRYAAAITS